MWKVVSVTLIMVLAIISYSCMERMHITNNLYAQDDTNNNNSSLYQLANNGTLAKIMSHNLVNYLNESASVLKITSNMHEVNNVQYSDNINSTLHGIAETDDVDKRQIAKNILENANTFEAITYLLPQWRYVYGRTI
jgi:hypothetical protein